jgi:hypothetical protein
MEEPPPPAALDPPILPLEDVVPLPPTVPTSFVPSADPVPTPLAMTHFALMETAQLLDTASAPPLPGHVVAPVSSPVQEKQALLCVDCHPCIGSPSCFAPAFFR